MSRADDRDNQWVELLDMLLSMDEKSPETSGIPELSDEMAEAIKNDLIDLRRACRVLIERFSSFDEFEESRKKFSSTYLLLKIIATRSINLMDSRSPSLQRLEIDQPFYVGVKGQEFDVF